MGQEGFQKERQGTHELVSRSARRIRLVHSCLLVYCLWIQSQIESLSNGRQLVLGTLLFGSRFVARSTTVGLHVATVSGTAYHFPVSTRHPVGEAPVGGFWAWESWVSIRSRCEDAQKVKGPNNEGLCCNWLLSMNYRLLSVPRPFCWMSSYHGFCVKSVPTMKAYILWPQTPDNFMSDYGFWIDLLSTSKHRSSEQSAALSGQNSEPTCSFPSASNNGLRRSLESLSSCYSAMHKILV